MSQKISTDFVQQTLQTHAPKLGFSHFGVVPLTRPLSIEIYHQWLKNKYHGEMNYLERHLSIKESPKEKWPTFKSVITLAYPYLSKIPSQHNDFPLKKLKVAQYAQGDDYHYWLIEKMNQLIQLMNANCEETFTPITDSAPLLERDFAYRAGIGWVGKNTCIIDRKRGSYFLLGEILTSLEFQNTSTPIFDFCGKCTKCLDICPTKALISPRVLDATKCISYWTIEAKSIPPTHLRENFSGWFFGCDLCQSICPWNQKPLLNEALERTKTSDSSIDSNNDLSGVEELRFILASSGKRLMKDFTHTPMKRAGPNGLKRNALIVIENLKIKELIPDVEKYLNHPKLGELAQWVLLKLKI